MARAKQGKSAKDRQHRARQRRAAKNLAAGMSVETALIKAGYSVNYAKSEGYKVVKRPYITSIFTQVCERYMEKEKLEMDALVKPYFDGLTAPLIVKSNTEGIACVAKDPETQEILPDHDIRMKAADKLISLYGGNARISEEDETPGPTKIFIRTWVDKEQHVHVHTDAPPDRETIPQAEPNGSGLSA